MKFRLLFFSLITCAGLSAQVDSLVYVQVNLEDAAYHDQIPNVNAIFKGNGKTIYAHSGMEGTFVVGLKPGNWDFHLSHPLYEMREGSKAVDKKFLGDTIKWTLTMSQIKVHELREIVVKAPGIPDTVYGSGSLSVADFELLEDGRMILLVYPKRLKKGSELLLYDGINVLNAFDVPEKSLELVHDFRGTPYVLTEKSAYGIHVNDLSVGISHMDIQQFNRLLKPIVDTNLADMYFTDFNELYPAFSYYRYDWLDSTEHDLIGIIDPLMMELYRAEYKWVDVRTKMWARQKERETGIDAQIWVGATYFTQSIFYKMPYAPMFLKHDTLFVFDYCKDQLFSLDQKGNLLDSVPIYHHYHPKVSGWKNKLIQDRSTGEIYAVYDKCGVTFLGHVNTSTGEIEEKVKLEFTGVDKLMIDHNFVYYVHHPFESIQKKFLYKERLPYNFGLETPVNSDL